MKNRETSASALECARLPTVTFPARIYDVFLDGDVLTVITMSRTGKCASYVVMADGRAALLTDTMRQTELM